VSASAAPGRSTSAANSVTTPTTICWSSVGVRSNRPVPFADGSRAGLPSLVAAVKLLVNAPAVRNPVRVASNTTRSVCFRNPSRSIARNLASLLSSATPYPIASRPVRTAWSLMRQL
jgi:hypothetical protein